jgi:intracellular multiplication protein IcmO
MGGYKARLGVRVNRTDRITLQDLKDQVEGDIHIFVKSSIIRGRTFYSAPKLAKAYRLNHYIKVLPPNADIIRARRLDVRHLIQSLQIEPFAAMEAVNDRLSVLTSLQKDALYLDHAKNKKGRERGIFLFERLAATEDVVGEEGQAAGSAGGLANKPVNEPVLATLAPAPAADGTLAGLADMMGVADAPVAVEPAPVVETFDGANLAAADLATTNLFGTTVKVSLVDAMASIAAAAQPLIEGLFDLSPIEHETPAEQGSTGKGDLDRGETAVRLNRIALGLGADSVEAQAAADSILAAAIEGTEYPKPPKPAATPDKRETMESVMDDLAALMAGVGGGGQG